MKLVKLLKILLLLLLFETSSCVSGSNLKDEFYIINEMVDLSQVTDKVKSYINTVSEMLSSAEKHDNIPPYADLPTDFKLDISDNFKVALTHLESWQLSLIIAILNALKTELESMLESIVGTKEIIAIPNDQLKIVKEEQVDEFHIAKRTEVVNVVTHGTSPDSTFRSQSSNFLMEFAAGFIDTIQKIAEGGDIIDITLEVIEDLLTVDVETSIDLPSEATQAQLKSFSYTQLLAVTESLEHSVRVLHDKVNTLLRGIMNYDEGSLNPDLMSPTKLQKKIKKANSELKASSKKVAISPHTAFEQGTVPVTRSYYKNQQTNKEFLAYNMFLKTADEGTSNPIKNMDTFVLESLDHLWLVNLVVNIIQSKAFVVFLTSICGWCCYQQKSGEKKQLPQLESFDDKKSGNNSTATLNDPEQGLGCNGVDQEGNPI